MAKRSWRFTAMNVWCYDSPWLASFSLHSKKQRFWILSVWPVCDSLFHNELPRKCAECFLSFYYRTPRPCTLLKHLKKMFCQVRLSASIRGCTRLPTHPSGVLVSRLLIHLVNASLPVSTHPFSGYTKRASSCKVWQMKGGYLQPLGLFQCSFSSLLHTKNIFVKGNSPTKFSFYHPDFFIACSPSYLIICPSPCSHSPLPLLKSGFQGPFYLLISLIKSLHSLRSLDSDRWLTDSTIEFHNEKMSTTTTKPRENVLKRWTQATSLPTLLPSLPQTVLQSSCCVSARLAPAVHLPPAAWNWCFTGRMWTHLASQRSVWGEMCLAFINRPLAITTKKVTQTHFLGGGVMAKVSQKISMSYMSNAKWMHIEHTAQDSDHWQVLRRCISAL